MLTLKLGVDQHFHELKHLFFLVFVKRKWCPIENDVVLPTELFHISKSLPRQWCPCVTVYVVCKAHIFMLLFCLINFFSPFKVRAAKQKGLCGC